MNVTFLRDFADFSSSTKGMKKRNKGRQNKITQLADLLSGDKGSAKMGKSKENKHTKSPNTYR